MSFICRLPSSDSAGSGGLGRRRGGGLCSVENGGVRPTKAFSPPSPPSSDGSKSSSPLLNGNATVISSPLPVTGAADNGAIISNGDSFFGKHDGFTLSPVKSKPSVVANGVTTSGHQVKSTVKNHKNAAYVPPQPVRKAPSAPSSSANKIVISSPSLKGSTNRAVLSSTTTSTTVPKSLPPPPPPSAPLLPPVAIVNPQRRPTNANSQPRPLSVPDHTSIMVDEKPTIVMASQTNVPNNSSNSKPSTVARLASFLSKKDKSGEASDDDHDSVKSHTLPRKAAKINRESLMQLEISAPMQLQATKLPENLVPVRPAPCPPPEPNLKPSQVKVTQVFNDKGRKEPGNNVSSSDEGGKAKVTFAPSVKLQDKSENNSELQRIGSVREQSVTMRPPIPKFGSMRAPRPKSLPPPRPSEPPPRPPLPKIPSRDSDEFYDDCVESLNASVDDVPSPNDSIYATIPDDTASVQLTEPFYANNAAIAQEKQPKKSVFSMLYAKAKKKKKEEVPEEPFYCNIGGSDSVEELDKSQASTNRKSPSRSSSTSPPDRASRESSEEGGLFSEIVSELGSRQPEFKIVLSKNKQKGKGEANVKDVKLKEKTEKISGKPGSNSASVTKNTDSATASKQLPKVDTSINPLPKSVSYPWKNEKANNESPLHNSLSSDCTADKTAKLHHSSKPRGVMSYLKRNLSDDKEKIKAQNSEVAIKDATPDIKCPITAVSNTTITTHISKDTSVPQLKGSTKTDERNTQNVLPASKSLESSLAAVRAASSQLHGGGGTSANNLQQLNSSRTTLPVYTNVPAPSHLKPKSEEPFQKLETPAFGHPSKAEDTNNKSSREQGSLLSKNIVNYNCSVSQDNNNATTRPQKESFSSHVNTVGSTTLSLAEPVSSSVKPISKGTSSKSSRPVFPPDKIVFPPDKSNLSSNKASKKDTTVTTTTGNSNLTRGSARSSGPRTKTLAGKSNKVTSPVPPSVHNNKNENKSLTTIKSGRVLSPSRPATSSSLASGKLSLTNSNSDTSDKSRSVTPQPAGKAGVKTAPARAKSPTSPTEQRKDSLAVRKQQSAGKGISGRRQSSGSSSSASKGNSTAYAGKSVGNSNVASLQQKFEKGTADNTGSKTTEAKNKVMNSARRTSADSSKPNVAPKPK